MSLIIGGAVVSIREVFEVVVVLDGVASIGVCDDEESVDAFITEATGIAVEEE